MTPEPTDPTEVETLQRQMAQLQAKLAAAQRATLTGPGALAKGGSTALGERAVNLENNSGNINTGFQFIERYYAAVGGDLSKEQIAHRVARYLHWLRSYTASIELRGIQRPDGTSVVSLPLETAYVPLRARPRPRGADALEPQGRNGRGTCDPAAQSDDPEPEQPATEIPLNQALGLAPHLVIIGGPGSGKTTVLMHMAWALASSLLADAPEPTRSRLGLAIPPHELPLPIFMPLAYFARHRRNQPAAAPPRARTLANGISCYLIGKQASFDLPDDFFAQLLEDGRNLLLLLDGLDEVANEDERAAVREAVVDLVRGHPQVRVVVTCRTIAYRSALTVLGAGFREIVVQPLDFAQHVTPMVRQAYACIHRDDATARAGRAQELLDRIRQLEDERRLRLGQEAKALVDSPLMVRLLLIVNESYRQLPDARADLFDKAIEALLRVDYGREEEDRRELATDWEDFREMAQHLAAHLHQQGRDQGREIDERAVAAALRQNAEFKPYIKAFLSHARQRGSVVEERDGTYRFIHLAFQEFLVARYLAEVTGRDSRKALLDFLNDHLEDPWWREPILLLAGYLAKTTPGAARDFLGALAEAGTTASTRYAAAELAGAATLEWQKSGEALRARCAQRILTLMTDADECSASRPPVRARAGDTLARLGDPRFDPQRLHLPADDLLGFVQIPADPAFMIGTRTSDQQRVSKIIGYDISGNEINDAVTPAPAFYCARYPVTVAQFRAFVEASGVQPGDLNALRDPDSRPVRYVSWREAQQYCAWLNQVIPTLTGCEAPRLVREGAWQVALPSELEWEKAARGGLPAAMYAWGDDPDPNRANFADTEIGDTSPVGCFPTNGFGLYDMIGNVWEWTRSRLAAYPYRPEDGREEPNPTDDERFVVRGGSWGSRRGLARCAYRRGDLPDDRGGNLGFRVVLRAAPVSSSPSSVPLDAGL